ncbi:MAG TPA: zinc ribbon domain-containing protein [Planctomycetaceae bacterium]|jgi:hypothetical protein|nr:zinc ribbon domain-containing protein [Planctomycetaceae bacterium]
MNEPVEDDDWWKHGGSPNRDFPDEDDDVEDYADEPATIRCPHCGKEVFDDAEQCPACGSWFVRDRHRLTGRPSWFVVLGFVGALLAVVTWILLR